MEELYTMCHNTLVNIKSNLNRIDAQVTYIKFSIEDIKKQIAKPTDNEALATERFNSLCALLRIETYMKEAKSEFESSIRYYENYIDKWNLSKEIIK